MVDALAVLKCAADHLGLPEGRAPTGPEFEQAAREITLGMSKAQVQRAWVRWDAAVAAYQGGSPPLAAAQQAVRRHVLGTRRRAEHPVAGVRHWLATEPAGVMMKDYEAYAREHNEELADGEAPLLTLGDDIRTRLGSLRWASVVAVARNETTLEDAQEARKLVRVAYLVAVEGDLRRS